MTILFYKFVFYMQYPMPSKWYWIIFTQIELTRLEKVREHFPYKYSYFRDTIVVNLYYIPVVQNPSGNRIVLLMMDVYRLAKQVCFQATNSLLGYVPPFYMFCWIFIVFAVSNVNFGTTLYTVPWNDHKLTERSRSSSILILVRVEFNQEPVLEVHRQRRQLQGNRYEFRIWKSG